MKWERPGGQWPPGPAAWPLPPRLSLHADDTDDAGASPTLVGGSDTFNVGATLNVGATQASGTYSGTFAVTVNYN